MQLVEREHLHAVLKQLSVVFALQTKKPTSQAQDL